MLYRKRETQWIQLLLFLLTFSLLFTSSIAGPLIGGRGNPSKKIQKETSKAQAGLEELVNELMKVPHGRHSTTTKTNQHKTMLEDKIIKNHPLGAKTLLSSSSKTTISTIRLPLEGSPSHLNPCDIGSYADRILNRMFDPLVIPSPHDPLNITKYVPVMLKAFTEETLRDYTVETLNGTIVGPEDMTRWNLTLREYTWHDGVALTADDLVFSYQFQKWITTNADSYNLDEYYGPNKMNYLTVTRINNTTVSVYLNQTAWYKKRNALFIPVFPEHIYGHADTWTNQTGTFNTSNWWEPRWHVDAYDVVAYKISGSDDPILTGSGPWRLTDFNAEIPQDATEFSFQRYGDYYWDPYDANGVLIPGREPLPEDESRLDLIFNPEDPYFWGPYADQLEYHVLNETEEWNAFGDDTIILIDGHAVLNHTNNISAAGYPLITGQDNDIGGFSIQCNATYLTRQQKFRLALAYAIDKQNITDTVYSGYATPIDHPVSTAYDEPWYWDPEDNGYTDLTEPLPSEARDLIASLDQVNDTEETYLQGSPNATWTDSDGNVMVTLDYRTGDPLALEMAELIQGDLKDAGIKVELRGMSWGVLVGNLLDGSFMLSQHGWSVGDLPLVDLFWNESAYYATYQWDHPDAYYTSVSQFFSAKDQSTAVEALQAAEEILYNHQPFLTIEADQTVESYRNDTWVGVVTCEMGGLTTVSYRKMRRDTTPPSVTILTPSPNANISSTSVNVSWNRSDNLKLATETFIRLDGGAWVNTTNNWYEFMALPEGRHSVSVLVYDRANNTVEKTISFTIDSIAPTISIESPQNNTIMNASSVRVTWSGSDPSPGYGIQTYAYQLDGSTWTNIKATNHTFSLLAEGDHTVLIKAYDWVGNEKVASVSFIVDTVPPSISITSPEYEADAKPPIIKKDAITVAWRGIDYGSGIDHYEVRLDSNSWEAVDGTSYEFTDLRDGNHTVQVRAIDISGKMATASVRFTVNTSPIGNAGMLEELAIVGLVVIILTIIALLSFKKRREE